MNNSCIFKKVVMMFLLLVGTLNVYSQHVVTGKVIGAQLATSAASSGGDLSDKAAQMKDNIEQELNAMRSKMEALASTP